MPIWLTIILACGGTAVINCIVGLVFNRIVNGSAKNKQEKKKQEEERTFQMIQKAIDEAMKLVNEKLDLIVESNITMLRDDMKMRLDMCKERKWADGSDKASWNELYEMYVKLGGNNFVAYVNQWKSDMEFLPTYEEYIKTKGE